MIQRQQSLWLLLSTVCAFLAFKLPFFETTVQTASSGQTSSLDAGSNFFLLILTGGSLLLSLIAIFLYKDRKMQLKICYAGIGVSLLIIILFFVAMRKIGGSVPSLTSLFVFAILVGYIMATRGIWKDEKLVKSLDKLR